jgi:hypothetical protein
MTPSKPIAHKADLKTGPHLEPAFSAVVVGGDSIGGDLLASALVSEFRCAAIAVRASNFLQVLGARSFTLAIISADVDAHVGAGFDLANAASLAYPRILIVMLLGSTNPRRGNQRISLRCSRRVRPARVYGRVLRLHRAREERDTFGPDERETMLCSGGIQEYYLLQSQLTVGRFVDSYEA